MRNSTFLSCVANDSSLGSGSEVLLWLLFVQVLSLTLVERKMQNEMQDKFD